ncbi:MAG TPA: hypothetical protein VNA69_20535 [Thermoanaerobaculia bacterium]|nr:hypothetical protein [Thermoanaerobaculia bacterium]
MTIEQTQRKLPIGKLAWGLVLLAGGALLFLEFEQTIEENVRSYRVPPLLLQPLVENAVTHGVGQLIEGGTVQIAAGRNGDHVWIRVENRCDPDRASKPGEGIGLTNTRKRVATFYGAAARMKVVEEPARFRVELALPNVSS